jgi:Heavy metal binding domain
MHAKRAIAVALSAFVLLSGASLAPGHLDVHVHAAQAQAKLPPLQYTCPMHPEVLEDKPGSCRLCKMPLEPTRIDTELNYSCPDHPVVIAAKPGICPVDRRREMVPVVVTLHWTCKQSPDQKLMDPGKCADGSDRALVKQIRAHGDHNPRHGGIFYMAQDQWHHMEGTYPSAGKFRVYFFDNYTQPIDAKAFSGSVVLQAIDPATKAPKDVATFPLRLSRDGKTLEATLKGDQRPSKDAATTMVAKVRMSKDGPEQPFTFAFVEYSKDVVTPTSAPTSAPATTTSAGATVGKPASSATTTAGASTSKPTVTSTATEGAAAPTAAAANAQPQPVIQAVPVIDNCEPNMARTDALLLSDSLPRNSKALLNLLEMCSDEVQKLVQGSQFGFVYQPTMLGKDIALALENYLNEVPSARRAQASDAIRRTVLAAWQLDMFGDMGNQEKITEAFNHFAAAIAAVKTAYAAKP